MKLTIKDGSPIEVEVGSIHFEGSCIVLYESVREERGGEVGYSSPQIVVAYALIPGEKVRKISEDEYVVEY